MSDKVKRNYYVAGREGWSKEYGTLLTHLRVIGENFLFIQKFKSLDREPLKIVEYGCAMGFYLQVLKLLTPNHDLYGVDIAKEATEATAKVVGDDHVFCQSCGSPLHFPDNSFDIIYSFDMIEHIKEIEVLKFFVECARLIKPTGYIFIRTPNCNFQMRLVYKLRGEGWTYSGKGTHKNPFTERKLKKLLARVPLVVHEVSYSAGSMYDLCKQLPFSLLKMTPTLTFVLKKRLT